MFVPSGEPQPSVVSKLTQTVTRVLEPQILQSHGPFFFLRQHMILLGFPLYHVLWQQFYQANVAWRALLLGCENA